MNDDQKGLLYLFERPFEPLNAPRGRAGQEIIFQKEGEEVEDVATRFGSSATAMTIPASIPDILNELQMVKKIPKGAPFSHFNPLHRAAAKELIQWFMDPQIKEHLWQLAGSVRDNVNEALFIYALSFAIIRNPALDSRVIPPIYEVFLGKFIPQDKIQQARDLLTEDPSTLPEEIVIQHKIDFPGSDSDPELRVAYWREDYGINSHHWHWHLVFPLDVKTDKKRPGYMNYKHPDRKGEIFFYMHNQMMTRYEWERLSNGLPSVVRLDNWREPIAEGYEHQLTTDNSSKKYGIRLPNMTPQNITRRDIELDRDVNISQMERWRDRLLDAIRQKEIICENREPQPLTDNVTPGEKRGIDYLGDAFEADKDLSVNYKVYGSLHNDGHDLIAHIHDPDGQQKEHGGVIGFAETALRDPVFYRWHRFIDDVFQEYKKKQEPYKDEELIFDPVNVESVSVMSGGNDENVLETGWTDRRIEANHGLDFQNKKSVIFNVQHLTHRPFLYNITVTNNETEPVDVTVRLYMAPKFNGAGETMTFLDQRLLWAEMDRYHTTLQPGSNSLKRLSTDSSITIPEDRTFREIEDNIKDDSNSQYCGCGWPQHLLLPKGMAGGMDFQIFVLISDRKLDKVDGSAGKKTCSNAASFCGILSELYPDARPMGYPFDRLPNTSINNEDISNATDFAQALPNAFMSDIKIYFRGTDLNLG